MNPLFRIPLLCLLTALSAVAVAAPSSDPILWTPLGLSGGGGMFSPAVSPIDSNVMMLNCDMSGAYITRDGGKNWRMIPYRQLRSNTQCKPAFHPVDPKIIYAASGWEGLRISRDQGFTWTPVGKGLPTYLQGEIAIDPSNPSFMLAGADDSVYRSSDAGLNWTRCAGPSGTVIGFHFDRTRRDGETCFAGTQAGIWRSDDGGATWTKKMSGLPSDSINGFAGGSNANGAIMLYCTTLRVEIGGQFVGGVFKSADRGETWNSANGSGLNLETKAFDEWAMGPVANYYQVLTSDANPSVVYAFNSNTGIPPPHHATAYRSDDAGDTWHPTFQADPRFAGFNVQKDYVVANDGQYYQGVPFGVAGNPNDPNFVFFVINQCYLTHDGGKSWICANSRPGSAPGSWICNGLVVTTTWRYYLDPFQRNRRYICYTDLGFARSQDGDATWSWWSLDGRAPWRNTCYELAFDPKTPGKIWGAFSDIHDIPNDNIISGRHNSNGPGGVCLSLDYGATWKTANSGLPVKACTSVVLDPKSPASARTLYAGFFGEGVYKSADGGKSWSPRNDGLGADTNRRVCQVFLHSDGTLFALVTALRANGHYQPEGVGLFRSKDGGTTWEWANRSRPLLWPKGFAVDPKDSRVLYLSASDAEGREEGGLYRSADGGSTWKLLARKGPEHFGAFLSPFHRGWIYMTLTEGAPDSGLWLSRDDGATWTAMAGLPFCNAQRVAFDTLNPKIIYVTTFGGSVWRGPAEEGSGARSPSSSKRNETTH